MSCLASATNYVKCKKHEVWSVETVTGSTSVILCSLLTMTRDTVKTLLHTSTLATAPSSRHLVQNKMNRDGWNDNFNCGVLVCIINKEVRYKTPPNGWSGGGWRCGPHFTFPHQTRVHWFVSLPRLGGASGHVQFWVSGPESLLIGTRPALTTDIILQHVQLLLSAIRRFVITEKAPTRAFSWLKAPTSAFTFKTLLRHYAKWALTLR